MAALCRLRVSPYPAGTGTRDEAVSQPRTEVPVRRDFFNTQRRSRNQTIVTSAEFAHGLLTRWG